MKQWLKTVYSVCLAVQTNNEKRIWIAYISIFADEDAVHFIEKWGI